MNIQDLKVKQLTNMNQLTIRLNEQTIYFQSYDSICAKIEGATITLFKDWNYSRTTLKHLGIFIEEYAYGFFRKYLLGSNNRRKTLEALIKEGVVLYSKEVC